MRFSDILMAGHEENTKHAINKTLANYQTPWKVIHEALQNSLDAIYETTNSEGYISITLNIKDQSVSIRDDGVGFPHGEEGRRLLGLHGSSKSDPRLSGSLGYGIKAIICSTAYFRLASNRDSHKCTFEIREGHDLDQAEFDESYEKTGGESVDGSDLYYTFPNREVTDFLNELYDSTPGIHVLNRHEHTVQYVSTQDNHTELLKTLIKWYFRTQSYAANIDRLIHDEDSDIPKVNISLKIVGENLKDESGLSQVILDVVRLNDGVLETEFENKHWDIEEFFLDGNGHTKSGLPFNIETAIEFPVPETHQLKSDQVIALKFNNEEDYSKLIRYPNGKLVTDDRDEDYYDGKIFNALKGIYVVIGRKRYLDHLLFPAMPQRQSVFARSVPTQDTISLEPQVVWEKSRSEYTVVFYANVNDELNLGKLQIFFRRRLKWLTEFYTDAFKAHFRRMSSQVAPKELTGEDDLPVPEEEEPQKDFVDRERIFPAGAKRSLIVEPIYENELIALFFDLLGRGDIDGYQFYGLSGYSRYDGKAEIKLPGSDQFKSSINQDSKLWTIEFKVYLSRLVDELTNNKKRAIQLPVAIVWEIDDITKYEQDFKVVDWDVYPDISGFEYPPDRKVPAVQKILAVRQESRWIPIQILELKEVIRKIMDQEEY